MAKETTTKEAEQLGTNQATCNVYAAAICSKGFEEGRCNDLRMGQKKR